MLIDFLSIFLCGLILRISGQQLIAKFAETFRSSLCIRKPQTLLHPENPEGLEFPAERRVAGKLHHIDDLGGTGTAV